MYSRDGRPEPQPFPKVPPPPSRQAEHVTCATIADGDREMVEVVWDGEQTHGRDVVPGGNRGLQSSISKRQLIPG